MSDPKAADPGNELTIEGDFKDALAEARIHVDRSRELADKTMIQLARRTEDLEDADRRINVIREQADRELQARHEAVKELDQARLDAERGAEELADARLAVLKAREQRDFTLEQLGERTRVIENLTRENNILETLLNEERTRNQDQIAQLKAEVAELGANARAAIRTAKRDTKPRHMKRVAALRKAIARQREQVEALGAQLETAMASEADALDRVAQAQASVDEVEARVAAQVEERTHEAVAAAEAAIAEEREALRSRIENVEEQIEAARAEGRAEAEAELGEANKNAAAEMMKVRKNAETAIATVRRETAAQLEAADAEVESGLREQRIAAASAIRIAREEADAETERIRQDLEEKLAIARRAAERFGAKLDAEVRNSKSAAAELASQTRELEELRSKTHTSDAEISRLSHALDQARLEKEQALKDMKPRAARQMTELKARLSEAETKAREEQRRREAAEQAAAPAVAALAKVEEQRDAAIARAEQAEKRADEESTRRLDAELAAEEPRAEIDRLEDALAVALDKVDARTRELEAAQQEIDDIREELREAVKAREQEHEGREELEQMMGDLAQTVEQSKQAQRTRSGVTPFRRKQ